VDLATAFVRGTMDILEGRPLADPTPPRVPQIRPVSGRLTRINGYAMMSFAAAIGSGPPPDFLRGLPFIAMARAACRDPDPGAAGPALERIDTLLSTAEEVLGTDATDAPLACGLMMMAALIASTEPFTTRD
jgi:hypothetical protein